MTYADILTKVLNKAINNGYPRFKKSHVVYAEKVRYRKLFIIVDEDKYGGKDLWCVESIIFSHDFAKAFWGEGGAFREGGWQFHLQQMVLEEDPIKYLAKFI